MQEKKHTHPELEKLRNEIDEIDAELVSLLSKRIETVKKVLAYKKKHQLPVYHPAREEDLIFNRRSLAKDKGLDPDFVEDIFRRILKHSRITQSRQMSGKGIKPGATILIVGGTGEMGRFFSRWFEGSGYNVRLMGSRDWDKIGDLCKDLDLAMVSVPIDKTPAIIKMLAPHLPANCVLTDITSIKKEPMEAMLSAHPGPVVGLHPLFGPTPSTLDKQIIVATPGRKHEECRWITDQFAAWGAIIVEASAEEHDEIMGIVQALRHFATFAFGRFIAQQKVSISRTLEFSSPIYRLELGMVGRLFAQDPSLYAEIIFASDDRRQLLADYVKNIKEALPLIENKDKEGFIKEFRKTAKWFGPFSEQAMRESSYLIDKLIERF